MAGQVAINAVLGSCSYVGSQFLSGEKSTIGGILFNGLIGGIAGFLGGKGWTSGSFVDSSTALFCGRNFFGSMSSILGKNVIPQTVINALTLGGLASGFYSRYFNNKNNGTDSFWWW